jgi:hypothetical protein
MKKTTQVMMVAIAVAAFALMGAPALAFHDEGVAHCNGCHTMHNSAANPTENGLDNLYLLRDANSTDTCTRCHDTSYGNSWGASAAAPGSIYGGGQFSLLLSANLNDGHGGSTNPILGEKAGHNVISLLKGTVVDGDNGTSPGGTYNSNYLHCTSCHNPHGEGGHFRLLYGGSYGNSNAMGYTYSYGGVPAPEAVGIAIFGPGESNTNHTAFTSGMSEWCGACHGSFHNAAYPTTLKHPSGQAMGPNPIANYGVYNGTGDFTGSPGTSYLAMVPYEDPAVTDTSRTAGPTGNSKVMCLSCHRAHASSGPYSGRWDFNITIWEEEGVESGAYAIPNPYAATVGGDQRSLCNKCHAKDPVNLGHFPPPAPTP